MVKLKHMHSCVVKNCTNTKKNRPDMEFISVPKDLAKRKLWLKAAGHRLSMFGMKSVIYICEDHFDLEQDMVNYRLKPDVIPHKRLYFEEKQIPKGIQQNLVYIKARNTIEFECERSIEPDPFKCESEIKIEKEIKNETQEIKLKNECIENAKTLNPIRIQSETPKENRAPPNCSTPSPKSNPPPQENKIEFIAVPVNRTEFCKETVSTKPVKFQVCESCRKEFRCLISHLKSSIHCSNYWRRLENKIASLPKPIKIAPKPGPVSYKVSVDPKHKQINYNMCFMPEKRQVTITFDPDKMKMNTRV